MSKKTTNEAPLQQQMARLDELVTWFEQDDIDIEEAIEKFEEASTLAATIKVRLSQLKNNITILKERFDANS